VADPGKRLLVVCRSAAEPCQWRSARRRADDFPKSLGLAFYRQDLTESLPLEKLMTTVLDHELGTSTRLHSQAPASRRGFLVRSGASALGLALAATQASGTGLGLGAIGNLGQVNLELVPADTFHAASAQSYRSMMAAQQSAGTLASADHPGLKRLHAIANRQLQFVHIYNPQATGWEWQVNLLLTPQWLAWCMPAGKIAFYEGIMDCTDDQLGVVMAHEICHALCEHSREIAARRIVQKSAVERHAFTAWSRRLLERAGLEGFDTAAANYFQHALSMQYTRENEVEATVKGLELAARAGFDPRAARELWAPRSPQDAPKHAQIFATHPTHWKLDQEVVRALPSVMPVYERASRDMRAG